VTTDNRFGLDGVLHRRERQCRALLGRHPRRDAVGRGVGGGVGRCVVAGVVEVVLPRATAAAAKRTSSPVLSTICMLAALVVRTAVVPTTHSPDARLMLTMAAAWSSSWSRTRRNQGERLDSQRREPQVTDSRETAGGLRESMDIFEGTEQIQQLVISRAISGLRIE